MGPWDSLIRGSMVLGLVAGLTSCATLKSVLWDQDWNQPPPQEAPAPAPEPDEPGDLDGIEPGDDPSSLSFLLRSVQSVRRANEDLTPQQEYYLGRAFGAQVLASWRPWNDEAATRYVNLVGQSLALFAPRPETWSGYRFLILDSPQVNAFAAPGGFVFVTRGLLKVTRNEAELAAVLAHEVAHVALEHGLKAIRKDRLTGALLSIGSDAAQTFGDSRLQELATAFEGSVADLTRTIVNNGYSRETEYEADAGALAILTASGYPPQALVTMLTALKDQPRAEGGFTRTHPSPDQRIAEVRKKLGKAKAYSVTATQKARFQAALGDL